MVLLYCQIDCTFKLPIHVMTLSYYYYQQIIYNCNVFFLISLFKVVTISEHQSSHELYSLLVTAHSTCNYSLLIRQLYSTHYCVH